MATTKRHPLTKPQSAKDQASPSAPPWPSYTGTAQFVGTSLNGRVTVYVDPTLGQPGLQNAQDLVNDADRVVAANDNDFFGTPGGPVSVIIFAMDGATDGSEGADHNGCDYQTGAAIEVCASFGSSARVSGLFEAELSECSMGGNLCGVSTGEALSRWCAAVVSDNALPDFATAKTWAQNGMPDWVNRTDPTDRNPISTGCGMAFLSWLMSQGFDLGKIAPAMVSLGDSGTLAQLYASLTGNPASQAWGKFRTAVLQLPGGVTNDDPFGGGPHLTPLASMNPALVGLAGKVFSAILADLAQGKPDHQIVANVRAVLSAAGKALGGGCCPKTSHRLRASQVSEPSPDYPSGSHHGSNPEPGSAEE
ncbi:MAG: hypothetical protein JO112_04425 [Planctomycetes bacterium]|nr:hypothetical protein [Planctomycetota bacterium]